MKRVFALLLAVMMLLSLCACGSKDTAEGTKPSDSAQTPTQGKTEDTKPSGNDATEPKQTTPAESKPAESKPAETQPAPTTPPCNHSFKDATCIAPKTCSKCGSTEGEALGHNFIGGSCIDCNAADPNVPFTDHHWQLLALDGAKLYGISIDPYKGVGDFMVSIYAEDGMKDYGSVQHNGKTYYMSDFGGGAQIFYQEERGVVTIEMEDNETMAKGTLTLKRTGVDQFTITAVSGTIINADITKHVVAGGVFKSYTTAINPDEA